MDENCLLLYCTDGSLVIVDRHTMEIKHAS
jgi:hypothetical protein